MKGCTLFLLLFISATGSAAVTDTTSHTRVKASTWIEKKHQDEEDDKFYFKRHVQPHSIAALVTYCETQWMQEEKDSFKAMPENIAVHHSHYWYASWISLRTILLLDSDVTAEFKAKGVTDYDDMWLIILTSLHRRLNAQDANLSAVIEEVKKKRKKK